MDVSVITIFPELFDVFWDVGIVKKAIKMGALKPSVHCIRNFSFEKHEKTDDRPFGGGCGMVMKPQPISLAIKEAKKVMPSASIVLLSPQGKKLDHMVASQLSSLSGIIFVCGRYEGIDERVIEQYVDFEVSIGDYILTGGDLAAMVVIDSMIRLIPGVLGNPDSAITDTFSDGLIEYAQYTRPRLFDGESVPEVLLSGDHGAVDQWRLESSLVRTLLKRKDLLEKRQLTSAEIDILDRWRLDIEQIIQNQFLYSIDSLSSS